MVGQFHLKSLQCLHALPSTTNSMKIKALVHSHIFQHIWQVLRTLTKMKAILLQLVHKKKNPCSNNKSSMTIKKWKIKKEMKNKLISAITLHYNWCSNHVIPMEEEDVEEKKRHEYYDSTWNAILPAEEYYCHQDGLKIDDTQLSGYLEWLEEKVGEKGSEEEVDEIDELADKFIASCHEKFRLEKQESYRRYQEMLARSM